MAPPPIALTIAGSDSSGGAGIQADIKTFSSLGVYSASVITNITAQNTCGVQSVHSLPLNVIEAQLRAVFDDLNITCVKIGMLNTVNTINLVHKILQEYRPKYIVLDPVMISSSGKQLIETAAIEALKTTLFPISTLITPNIPEAATLLNYTEAESKAAMRQTLTQLNQFGSKAVLLKGGHLVGDQCIDLLSENGKIHEFSQTKLLTNNTHGTGCTLSSAISANLALGYSIKEAVSKGNEYLHNTIKQADTLDVGHGSGPVHHFYNQW
ncbi:MAG: hydroxymethylpyrimidine/phosphomethylpyrimidine kinase [Oleiphilaceae bacterium]